MTENTFPFRLRRLVLAAMLVLSGWPAVTALRAEEHSGWFSDDQAEWRVYKADYGRSSALKPDISLPLEIAWKKRDARSIGNTPCAADSFVFVASRDRRLICYNRDTGRQIFLRTYKGAVSGAVNISNLKFYFTTDLPDGRVYVTDINTKHRYQNRDYGPADAAPILEKDQMFLFIQTGKVICFNPETGVRQWQAQLKGTFEYAPVFEEPYLFIPSLKGVIYKVAVENGSQVGKLDLGHTLLGDLASDGDRLYLCLSDGRVVCVDMESLQKVWEIKTGQHFFCGPSWQDGNLFLASREGNLIRLSAGDGTEKWRIRLDGVSISTPTLAGKYVFTATKSGQMAAFDRDSGERLWQNMIKEGFSASPLVYGQYVFYCSDRGSVYALRPKKD